MAKKKPVKITIPDVRCGNKADAAQFFGIALPTLDKWIRDGMPIVQRGHQGVSWVIDLAKAAEWRYSSHLDDGRIDPETLSPGERKLWYDGETRRRELQVRDRKLIEHDEVEETVATAFAAIAQTLLALPDNLERRAGLSGEQAEVIEQTIHETLTDFADRVGAMAPAVLEE